MSATSSSSRTCSTASFSTGRRRHRSSSRRRFRGAGSALLAVEVQELGEAALRGTLLDLRPHSFEPETEVEQVAREVALTLDRDAEPLDRAAGLDDGAAGLPEGARGAWAAFVLADRIAEAARLGGDARRHERMMRAPWQAAIGAVADRGCGQLRIA